MPLSNPNSSTISKHSFRRKQQQRHRYNQNYHLVRYQEEDRDTRILINHCDLCNEQLPKEADNIQYRINVLDEIDDSYESEYDKHEPKIITLFLLLQGIQYSKLLRLGNKSYN